MQNLQTPLNTSYAWDISHALVTTYHPYCHSPSALTEYLKQRLRSQRAKRLSRSLPAQVEPNIQPERNKENIKINLFADDPTLYLNKNDRLDLVETILDEWCEVSGAKFNLEKTEIIPFGTATHRANIAEMRKINQEDKKMLDHQIKIARDGEAVCSLGAWIGNKINDPMPWETILDIIREKLERWNRTHPTLYGKRLIAQVVIGGHTQFLTKAQGMPPHIEEALTKILRDFIWDHNTHPRIALEYLYLPLDEGGLNLLDINSRNEAIEIMWVKAYLDLTPSRHPGQ